MTEMDQRMGWISRKNPTNRGPFHRTS